jgi:Tol biopolymer transport system component
MRASGRSTRSIFVANGDGTQERVVVGNSALDSNPSFTPDDVRCCSHRPRDGSADIYRLQMDGANLERLTTHQAFQDQAMT